MGDSVRCPFCNVTSKIVDSNKKAFAVKDLYPVREGHTLIIPKRHCSNFFELTEEEVIECFRLLKNQKKSLQESIHPDGYNIGINVGDAAGQKIFHVHIHLIPRFNKETPDEKRDIKHYIQKKLKHKEIKSHFNDL